MKRYRLIHALTALPAADALEVLDGLVIAPASAVDVTNGNSYPFGLGRTFIFIKNADTGGTCKVKPIVKATVPENSAESLDITQPEIDVPFGTTVVIGGFSSQNFADPSTQLIELQWTLSGGTVQADITVQVVTLP